MRILSIVSTFPQLSETFIVRKAIALSRRGHLVTICAREHGEMQWLETNLPAGVNVAYLLPESLQGQPRLWLKLIHQVAILLLRAPRTSAALLFWCFSDAATASRPWVHFFRHLSFIGAKTDVVHLEFLDLGPTYPLLHRLVGAPVVISCRGADLHFIHEQSPERQLAARESLLRASAVHCVSQEMADCVERFCHRTTGVWINRPGVAVPETGLEQRGHFSETPILLATGRLVWKKGFDTLIEAAAMLKARGLNFRLQILGGGPLRGDLEALIIQLGVDDVTELVGEVIPSRVLHYLLSASIFVLSSREEGISNALLEAMAVGLPVITTRAGGMEEVVADGVEGCLVPGYDARAIAESIERLLLHPDERERMGRSGRERVINEFTLDRQAVVFEALYHSLMAPPDRARRS